MKAFFCRDFRKLGTRVGLLEQTIAALQASNEEKIRVHAKEKAAFRAERDGLVKDNQTLCAERDTLAQAKASAEELATERQTQVEALTAERKQLIAARDKLMHENAALTTERDTLIKERQSLFSERVLLANLDACVKQQADDLQSLRKFTDASVKKHITNAAKQIEATLSLQSYFGTGELLDVNTENQAWPISPDFALYLVELIEFNDYDLIIEFGSGFSTSLVARVLARGATQRSDRAPVGFVSFEHLEAYYNQTLARLRQAGLAELVQLTLAPLEDWYGSDGATQPYYACESTLADLAARYSTAGLRVLVVVDGPPGNTAPQARYPAGPMVLRYFSGARLDFLLDDYVRDDEKEIAKRWQAEIAAAGFAHVTTVRKLEKDACLIQVNSGSCDVFE